MNELALFAGAGGGLLASRLAGWRTVCAVEISEYRRNVVQQRQRDGALEWFPIWDDVRTFDGRPWRGLVDIVTGGDPCQANSAAYTHGKRAESLGAQFLRIVEEVQPTYVIRENPARVRADAPWPADRFASGLEGLGYATAAVEIRACCLGADHRRARMFVLGQFSDADQKGLEERESFALDHGAQFTTAQRDGVHGDWWQSEPFASRVCGVADGLADRMDRIAAAGDGQVPIVVASAWELLT